MKQLVLACILVCVSANVTLGEWIPQPGSSPSQSQLRWFRRNTLNFEILSLNDSQGLQIANQIEVVKSWVLTRWGVPNVSFSKPCQVVCVPDLDTLKKLFRLNAPFGETRIAPTQNAACWVVYDNTINDSLCVFLTEISLDEYALQNNTQICYWAKRGMGLLNGNSRRVRELLAPVAAHIAADRKIFFSEPLFVCRKETIAKSSEENVALYDREVALLCLMLRKEFGQRRFLMLLTDSSPKSLYRATGYRSYSEFDKSLKRYLYYASGDIADGRMPDSYLTVQPVGGVR